MSTTPSFQDSPANNPGLAELIQRFREAEAALENALAEGVDAVIDPLSAIPILLQEAQAHLRASDARYRRLLSRNTVLVFELEADGTTVFINDAVFDLLGYTAQELLGRNWWDVVLRDEQRQQIEELYERFQSGDVAQYELTLTGKRGSKAIVELNTVNRRTPDGSLARILGLVLNITERRKAENELREHHVAFEQLSAKRLAELRKANLALQQLADLRQRLLLIEQAALLESEESNRIKVQFLATISHELRTPLTSIKGFATILLEPDSNLDTESQRDFLTIIDEEADKLVELIEQLIDSARLQAGTLRVRPEPALLTDIIGTALAQLKSVTPRHQLIIQVSPDLVPVMADQRRIAQVLVNLVSNAAKYSPAGTRITVAAAQQDTTVRVDVRDEGPGIAVENREKVFEVFSRLEAPTAGNVNGVGLGLAICQGIITAHGGKIWVAEGSAGTTMSFTLPTVPSRAGAFDPAELST